MKSRFLQGSSGIEHRQIKMIFPTPPIDLLRFLLFSGWPSLFSEKDSRFQLRLIPYWKGINTVIVFSGFFKSFTSSRNGGYWEHPVISWRDSSYKCVRPLHRSNFQSTMPSQRESLSRLLRWLKVFLTNHHIYASGMQLICPVRLLPSQWSKQPLLLSHHIKTIIGSIQGVFMHLYKIIFFRMNDRNNAVFRHDGFFVSSFFDVTDHLSIKHHPALTNRLRLMIRYILRYSNKHSAIFIANDSTLLITDPITLSSIMVNLTLDNSHNS